MAMGPETAVAEPLSFPKISVTFEEASGPQEVLPALQLTFLVTVLTLAPAMLILLTAFTRIIVVLSLLRQAIGTPDLPPNQVLIGMALFLTFFVMAPVSSEINQQALQPYLGSKISQGEALERAAKPIRAFMFKQTREKDLALMVGLANLPRPKDLDMVPTSTLIPAFVISELKTAFQIGFVLFIPFLIIDMVVTSVLLSMGMLFLPPVMISLPLKILLFVMADGWPLVVQALVMGFR
ncbi:MAG: flagellar type III secretion system pore protein FliP [Candidatus Methylomirabilales bacterium]